MNIKLSLSLIASLMLPLATHAQFQVKDLGLSDGGATNNVFVVQQKKNTELGKYSFSYNIDEIIFNHQYDAAKHVIDGLQMPDQTKIYTFWYNSLIEKNLTPKSLPEGSVTLDNILRKSTFDTSMVKNKKDFDAFLRHNFTEKLNAVVPVQVNRKIGNLLLFTISNHSDFGLQEIYGNLRIVDSKTKRVYVDEDITKTIGLGMGLASGKDSYFRLRQSVDVDGWKERQEDLAYKFTVKRVRLSNGLVFDADQYYFKIMSLKPVVNEFPFTQIKEN